jgi:hypothetical protein
MTNRNARLIRELENLRLPELQERYRAAVGEETRCPNRTYLVRRIREALEAQARNASTPQAPTRAAARASRPTAPPVVAAPPERRTTPSPPTEVVSPAPEANGPDRQPAAAAEATLAQDEPPTAPAAPPPRVPPTPAPRSRPAPCAARRARERPQRGRFASMTVDELQTLYLSVVGRPTGSRHPGYLRWKVREAENGRVPVGQRETRTASQEAVTDLRILPLRLDAPRVAALDATWRAKGMKSRMDLFRRALAHYLAHVGAHGAAALFEAP